VAARERRRSIFLRAPLVFTKEEIVALAQQRSGGRFHIYMYTDPDPTNEPKKADRRTHLHEFEKHRLENHAHELFGV
jgi:hypothetical protein